MYIYKITNKVNGKIYIGQVYNKSVNDRFVRHIREARSNSRSYIDRAINKYGQENFICETIDTANNLEELNDKERYWISYYNSTNKNIGYNLTNGGDGGNTYLCKTKEEMDEIKHKISKANFGENNHKSKKIKALNVNTNEILHFVTVAEICSFFNLKHKETFIDHCEHKAKFLWKGTWTFAYEEDEFDYVNLTVVDRSCNKGTKVKLINLNTNEEQVFNSLNKLNEFLNVPKGKIKFSGDCANFLNYRIIKLQVK